MDSYVEPVPGAFSNPDSMDSTAFFAVLKREPKIDLTFTILARRLISFKKDNCRQSKRATRKFHNY